MKISRLSGLAWLMSLVLLVLLTRTGRPPAALAQLAAPGSLLPAAPARPAAAPLQNIAAVATRERHTCALTSTGGVKCWGFNLYGQLGDGTTTDRLTPVDVVGLGSGVSAIAAGGEHTCALTDAGGVKCWGENDYGQLGDGTTTRRLTPVDVVGLGSGVSGPVAGGGHTCALTSTGGVKCWGYNLSGELGDGTTTQRLAPVDVVGLGSGIKGMVAGGLHTCVLTSSGGVRCWGFNHYGELGDGTTTQRLIPIDVVGLGSGVSAIAAGYGHTCALNSTGAVKCWGTNDYGELGDGTTTQRLTPVDVVGLGSGASAIAAGASTFGSHTCVVTGTGGVKCWGSNASGQLGDGTGGRRLTPVSVVGLGSAANDIAVGRFHTCALTGTGGAKCWGFNLYGKLGDGTTTQRLTPVDVVGLSRASAITAGGGHTCALTDGGGVKCWGENFYGQLGDGMTGYRVTPVAVIGLSSGVSAIATGQDHTCVLTTSGGVKCWGSNASGQLGNGMTGYRVTPVDVVGLGSGVSAIAAGGSHTCALTGSGGVMCWGENDYGQLGDGTTSQRLAPVGVIGLGSGVSAIAAGYTHTCALISTGVVRCWGENFYGQLGDGTTTQRLVPVGVIGLGSGISAIAAGGEHTCALTGSGGVRCWGENDYGQLGDGTAGHRLTPVGVVGLDSGVSIIAAGKYHTCALTGTGGVKCWGDNFYGQLGDGNPAYRVTPVDVIDGITTTCLPLIIKGAP